MKNPVAVPINEDEYWPWNCRACIRAEHGTDYDAIIWESAVAEGQELSNEVCR